MKKERTYGYMMTVDVKSAVDMEKLAALRRTIKRINKMDGSKYYVKCHGRGSRIEAAWMSGNPMNYRRYCAELPLRFADRMDVYVYSR